MGANQDVAQAIMAMANCLFDANGASKPKKPAETKSRNAGVRGQSLYGIVMRIVSEHYQVSGRILHSRAVSLVQKLKNETDFMNHVVRAGTGMRTRYEIKDAESFERYVADKVKASSQQPVPAQVVQEKPPMPAVAPVVDCSGNANNDVPDGYFSFGRVQEMAKIGDLRDYLRRNKHLRPVIGEPEMIDIKGKPRPCYSAQRVHAFLNAIRQATRNHC